MANTPAPVGLTPERVASLWDLEAKATPGEWHTVDRIWLPRDAATFVIAGHFDPHLGTPVCDVPEIMEWPSEQDGPDYSQGNADMRFIAALRNEARSLLSAAEENARLREALNEALRHIANTARTDPCGHAKADVIDGIKEHAAMSQPPTECAECERQRKLLDAYRRFERQSDNVSGLDDDDALDAHVLRTYGGG